MEKEVIINKDDQIRHLRNALRKACKVLRENPPMEMDWFYEDMDRLQILLGGMKRDPEGDEWALYFINQSIKEDKRHDTRNFTAGNDNCDESKE